MLNVLWTVVVILFVLWLAGLLLHIGGALIHVILVVAVALMIFNFITKGRASV